MKHVCSRPRWEFKILWLLTTSLPFSSQLLGGACWYDSRTQEVRNTRQVSVDPESLPGIEPLRGVLAQKHLFWSLWSHEMKVYCDFGVGLQ